MNRPLLRAGMALLERNLLPDPVVRAGIRRVVGDRLRQELAGSDDERRRRLRAFERQLRQGPIATATDDANRQHYEVPTDFFRAVLGPQMKYSCCTWSRDVADLAAAETASLEQVMERAEIADGCSLLDLGCGWGSLTLFVAERCPHSRITAVTSSDTQRRYVEEQARLRGWADRIEVIRCDVSQLELERRFDRIASIEMFEHLRNYDALMRAIRGWLHDDGRLFVHVFCHRDLAYPYEVQDESDWMARYFFTGGVMPSADLLARISDALDCESSWLLDGTHYARTAEAWLARMDAARDELLPVLERTYGRDERDRWWAYWRVFFLACAEMFGYRGGSEWMVVHHRFRPADGGSGLTVM